MYKTILIAMDETDASKKAARKGITLAKKDGSKVIGVHVLDENELNLMDVGSDEINRLKSKQRVRGEIALEYLEKLAKRNKIKYELILKEGEIDDLIIKIADVHDVDLILLGTKGRRGFASILDKDTSDELTKECPDCPVMVA